MKCLCFSPDFLDIGRKLRQTAHLMVGVPDYDAYLAHMSANHPDAAPMDRAAFWRERESARFGEGRALRCC